ncbi:Panacea domain-containing protein [uncultured Adlercreutzia sp.]|uniref:Panacea domain-containing protein n=1 Tax=uncultured Adlercreutzia sp. TaxID=875803 RepID=UPI0025E939EA|nr:type II toxin-antitoxin system antitoxin SocA domain-containing protein [uncultured Adlercreutzia sp.]MCI9261551.1 DUF4065 domain-containing protein [Eggerthellaceae bacterium]
MARVLDVATYVLNQTESISTMKLQKLVYYSQAFHLVREGSPLFPEDIEAWANGPVIPELFKFHKGEFVISRGFLTGSVDALNSEERASVDHVIERLGDWSGAQLSDLTHSEDPWRVARGSLPPRARSQTKISCEVLRVYYRSCPAGNPVFA